MAKQLPLSKARLHELLKLYEGRVPVEMIGGYDTGVYFSFKGKMKPECMGAGRIVAGRIAGKNGFCSEALCITNGELHRRDHKAGLECFWRRVEERQVTLTRWAEAYYTDLARSE